MISSLELAKICGVSQGTVDRALHGRKGISAATKRKILDAAKKHGYHPNPAAREIMTGDSLVVGMLVPRFDRFFLMDLADAIKRRLVRAGFRLYLSTVEEEADTQEVLADFAARRAKAVILVPPLDKMRIPKTITEKMKIITLLNDCPDPNTVFICPDEYRTGSTAVDMLTGKGHQNILHLTYTRCSHSIKAREQGYVDRMSALSLNPCVIKNFNPVSSLDFIRKNHITAVFCHNDWLAFALMQTALKNGLTVPRDLAILGVDNSPSFVDICRDISTLEYPFEWVAAEILKLIIAGGCPDSSTPGDLPSGEPPRVNPQAGNLSPRESPEFRYVERGSI